jgi:two-component system, LytTR family, response regulator
MKVLIVDDEPVARRGLRKQLTAMPGITCVGECGGCNEAVTAIVERQPDVALLDIQLGGNTAFEIIEEIGVDAMPLVIFITAYDRHALKAFEVHALDYVLKPVDPERLRDALERAAATLALKRGASLADRLEGLLADRSASAAPTATAARSSATRFVVRDGERLLLIDIDGIDWFESSGNYVRVHSGGRAYMMRATMDTVARRLTGNADFVRVRRSAVINVRAIAALERYAKSAYLIRLRSGSNVISSRYYLPAVRALLRPS